MRLSALVTLGGHGIAGLVFIFFALTTTNADPQARIAAAVVTAVAYDIIYTLFCLGLIVIWYRRRRRRRVAGMAYGLSTGAILVLLCLVAILAHTRNWSGHCPCDPPINFGQHW